MVIVGILSIGLWVFGSEYLSRARDTGRVADIRELSAGLKVYSMDNGRYPAPLSNASVYRDGEVIGGNVGVGVGVGGGLGGEWMRHWHEWEWMRYWHEWKYRV